MELAELLIAGVVGLLAFVGTVAGHWVSRKSGRELDTWRRREESMRTLRWAAEMSVHENQAHAALGVNVIDALSRSEMLQPEDKELVNAVGSVVIAPVFDAAEAYHGRSTGVPDAKNGGGHGPASKGN